MSFQRVYLNEDCPSLVDQIDYYLQHLVNNCTLYMYIYVNNKLQCCFFSKFITNMKICHYLIPKFNDLFFHHIKTIDLHVHVASWYDHCDEWYFKQKGTVGHVTWSLESLSSTALATACCKTGYNFWQTSIHCFVPCKRQRNVVLQFYGWDKIEYQYN